MKITSSTTIDRRSFLKKLGALAGLALVAPATLLTTKGAGLPVADNVVSKGMVDFTVNDSMAAKIWSKHFFREMQADGHFHNIMGKGEDALLRVI